MSGAVSFLGADAGGALFVLGTVVASEVSLVSVCLVAFLGVMVILGFLSVVIRVLTWVFPARVDGVDWATRRAVELAIERRFPGARVVEIRERADEVRGSNR